MKAGKAWTCVKERKIELTLSGKNVENPWISKHMAKDQEKLKLYLIFSLNPFQNRKFFGKNGILKPNALQNSNNGRRKWGKKKKMENDSLAIRSENSKKDWVGGLISQEITSIKSIRSFKVNSFNQTYPIWNLRIEKFHRDPPSNFKEATDLLLSRSDTWFKALKCIEFGWRDG